MVNKELAEVSVSKIVPYENNPRINDSAVDAVKKSIEQCDYISPIVVDENMVVLAGHTRLKALQELGEKKCQVVVVSGLSEEQKKKYRLLDNKTNELAGWDFEMLEEELQDLDFGDLDLDWGIDLYDEEEKEVTEDDYEGEIPEVPKSKIGQIYKLGRNRIMCGDSTDEKHIKALMNGEIPDMVFTDPPYGMNLNTDYSGMKNNLDFAQSKNFKGGKKYDQGKVDDFKPEMVNECLSLGAKEVFLWGADYFAEMLPNKNEGSWIVWDKRANESGDLEKDYSSDKMYGSCFELCWSKKKHKREIARVKWAGVFGTEQEFDHKRHHPTQKPIKLSSWFVKKYSEKDWLIVDLFGGSGSTLIACEQLERICYMMELDPKYVDVIIDRWEKFTGEKAVLLEEV